MTPNNFSRKSLYFLGQFSLAVDYIRFPLYQERYIEKICSYIYYIYLFWFRDPQRSDSSNSWNCIFPLFVSITKYEDVRALVHVSLGFECNWHMLLSFHFDFYRKQYNWIIKKKRSFLTKSILIKEPVPSTPKITKTHKVCSIKWKVQKHIKLNINFQNFTAKKPL